MSIHHLPQIVLVPLPVHSRRPRLLRSLPACWPDSLRRSSSDAGQRPAGALPAGPQARIPPRPGRLGACAALHISATVDPENLKLVGNAQHCRPQHDGDPWTNLVFRLYPMLDHYGGNMVVQSALVNGKPATFVYTDDNTALTVDLDRPLLAAAGSDRTTCLAPRNPQVGRPIQCLCALWPQPADGEPAALLSVAGRLPGRPCSRRGRLVDARGTERGDSPSM